LDQAQRDIETLVSYYKPGTQRYRFLYLFKSVVEDPAKRVRPPDVEEAMWRQALQECGGPDNPDK
jgi:hypothetical protein